MTDLEVHTEAYADAASTMEMTAIYANEGRYFRDHTFEDLNLEWRRAVDAALNNQLQDLPHLIFGVTGELSLREIPIPAAWHISLHSALISAMTQMSPGARLALVRYIGEKNERVDREQRQSRH